VYVKENFDADAAMLQGFGPLFEQTHKGVCVTTMGNCRLHELCHEAAQELWDTGHGSEGWPKLLAPLDNFLAYYEQMAISFTLGEGGIWGIYNESKLIGFVTLSTVPNHWLEAADTATECGTYLLPAHRGQGFNTAVKTLTLQRVFDTQLADVALFAIPVKNHQALTAMRKLPWNFSRSTRSSGLYSSWTKRKSFDTGENLVTFSLLQTDFKTR